IEPDDAVWVQDYHMIPLGQELRRRGCRNRLGFFLHIPWPPPRLLATLPEARDLVRSMFAYDVIGFQTDEWLEAFRGYIEDELGIEVRDNVVRMEGAETRLIACPIGIDAAEFEALANAPAALETAARMAESANRRVMIVGVDRLDYSKGVEERFRGYERFLTENPEERKEVFLLQIAPTSRGSVDSYRQIRATLESLSGRINGEHADLDWVPIRYVNRNYRRENLAGVYQAAKIALVTPLRDGMNLVAKEFVAAQDPKDPGVLILSRFAGAAEQLGEALLVNPHSAEEIADSIRAALRMPLEERIARWQAMKSNVDKQDVHWWRKRFTETLMAAPVREVGTVAREAV
ncbi:MAG TPA: trehalose-6-phosphate synthase, partial [Sphingomicrobium sp.]